MRRRLLKSILAAFAVVGLGLALLPYWFAPVLGWAARPRGLTFARYERIGYSRFALSEVEYRRGNVRVTASRVELDSPLVWSWHHFLGRTEVASVGSWRVEVVRSGGPSGPPVERGWIWLQALLHRIVLPLDRWLPRATTEDGRVQWPGGEVNVRSVAWSRRELSARGVEYRGVAADATVAFSAGPRIQVSATGFDGQARASLETEGPRIHGTLAWWEQPLTLEANYAAKGWLPAEALVQLGAWEVPGERVRLASYPKIRGTGKLEWRVDRFSADFSASGEPVKDTAVPPLEAQVRVQGDTRSVTVEALRALAPGVRAELTGPVVFSRGSGVRESAANFAVEADLARVPWFKAEGTLSGSARVVSPEGGVPRIEFTADARAIRAAELSVPALEIRGSLAWPRLDIAAARLTGAGGEQLSLRGGWDFRSKEIVAAAAEGELRRATLERWLPAQPRFDRVSVEARAEGPLAALRHEGKAEVDTLEVAGLKPLAARVDWRGRNAVFDRLDFKARSGAARIEGSGRLEADGLSVTALQLFHQDAAVLELSTPARIAWRPHLAVEGVSLKGGEAALEGAAVLGPAGKLAVSARRFPSRWISDLVSLPGPAWTIASLDWRGTWDRAPMEYALNSAVEIEIGADRGATVVVAARGDAGGLVLESLRASEVDEAVVDASGRVPIQLSPGTGPFLRLDEDGALAVQARVAPNAAFWTKLATATGVEIRDPRVSAELTGTWKRPLGRASLEAARLAIDPRKIARPIPAVDDLRVEVSGDRAGVTLTKFHLSVEGQSVRAEGRLPLPDQNWSELLREPWALARRGADLRVEIPEADVAAFTRYLPAVLAPKGRVQADLRYSNGGFEGFVRLSDAATRPLGPLGVLQEIRAEATFSGRTLTLKGVTARSGGQPVTLSGTVALPEEGGPRFDLALRGGNLPFVRQTGLLVRGDLDLKLQTADDAAGRLSGTVRLRDSLFLADVRSFLPKGGASARRRPPYFAIETPPMNTWQLAVDVTGERFLRLRTPVFVGVASARFRLGGTLGEPRAIGEVAIDEGTIRMPFASFTVTQGTARLTEADPFEPAVYVRGTGRRYGYDLTMEVDGSAAQPDIVFASSPALESEQVLLMVMTGTAPRNEIANTATQRVANVGLFLGQSLLSSLGSDAAEADRLSFASGEKISRQGKETYDIEYKLTDRWAVTGEYNEFDEYNAGLKWRVFREKTGGERKADAGK